jgi:Resolvase, N terminal domain
VTTNRPPTPSFKRSERPVARGRLELHNRAGVALRASASCVPGKWIKINRRPAGNSGLLHLLIIAIVLGALIRSSVLPQGPVTVAPGIVPPLVLLAFALAVLSSGFIAVRTSEHEREGNVDALPGAEPCPNLRQRSDGLQWVRTRRGTRLYHSREGIEFRTISMVGYASEQVRAAVMSPDFTNQTETIASECERRGLALLEIVRESDPGQERALERPGLGYALSRISAGEAQGLVVAELSRLTDSVSELGRVLEWFSHSQARLVAAAPCLDTKEEDSQLAVRTIIEVSRW